MHTDTPAGPAVVVRGAACHVREARREHGVQQRVGAHSAALASRRWELRRVHKQRADNARPVLMQGQGATTFPTLRTDTRTRILPHLEPGDGLSGLGDGLSGLGDGRAVGARAVASEAGERRRATQRPAARSRERRLLERVLARDTVELEACDR